MERSVSALVTPRTVAVVGASAKRRTQGNGVIQNLRDADYQGRIIPVHATAETVDGLEAVAAIDQLPRGIDVAVVAIPAAGVAATLRQLDRAGVRSAMVFTNGFSLAEETEFRQLATATGMVIHGPNCMGLINVSDSLALYPSTITEKVQRGKVALIAQSGSAAISLMNSTSVGFSKVVTMGSEFQVTAPDYIRWFADDDKTSVVGIVLESIKDPADFAVAVERLRQAGKPVVVLKVGKSDVGALAVKAHTGALISHRDAYACYFAQCGIPTVGDYDELIACMECFALGRTVAAGNRIGVVGISGGETALACDIAADVGVPVATFSTATTDRIRGALSGASGRNPLDLGATVHHSVEQDAEAIDAILDDAEVDALLVIQDAQGSLTPTMLGNYTPRIQAYGRHGQASSKPVVMVSPTSENIHPRVQEELAGTGVPVLRGLRAGLVALRNLGVHGHAREAVDSRFRGNDGTSPGKGGGDDSIKCEISGLSGPLPAELVARTLTAYEIPLVRTVGVHSADEAVRQAEAIGYPLVVKILSPDVAHRSDVGGVEIGVQDPRALTDAIDRILRNTRAAKPDAKIEGFELQEQLIDHVEAMAGFVAAPPFGALTMIGTGGTLVELETDRAVRLSPFSTAEAERMIASTRLGIRLGGYRKLIPNTDLRELTRLVSNLSRLAADLADCLAEGDLNPVLVRKGTGEIRVVDALLIAGKRLPG